MRKKQPQIVLQRKGRAELERLLADGNTAQKIAKRARIVLMSADGHGVMAIMREAGVSKTTVWRWQEYFDPDFAKKVEDIVGLYLDTPEKALVLSIDEKSQIQALDRTQPGLPLKKGRAGTMTHA